MSKFNRTSTAAPTRTTNFEGAEAYKLDELTELYIIAANSLGGGQGDSFYRSATAEYKRLLQLIDNVTQKDPAFIFQLAAYCRKDMYLRSVPVILFVEGIRAMHRHKRANAPYPVKAVAWAEYVFGRPDEITEALAYWNFVTNPGNVKNGGESLPIPFRRALELALNKFSEYSLTKYNQTDKQVALKDVLRVVRPKPKTTAQGELFNYLIRDTIVHPDLLPLTTARKALLKATTFNAASKKLIVDSHATWETVISKFGSSTEVWNFIIQNMGYMALLRNLNNFIKHDVDVIPVITTLTNPDEVAKSKQLPFRFLSALKAITGASSPRRSYDDVDNTFAAWKSSNGDVTGSLKVALGKALELSVVNVPKFSGRTLIAADTSGSMDAAINDKSTITRLEIGAVMAALAHHLSDDAIASVFGTSFEVVKRKDDDTVLDMAQNIARMDVGYATNAYLILDYVLNNKIICDRIAYVTDTQCYGGSMNTLWAKYRNWIATKGRTCYLYEINLAGYGTSNFDRNSGVAVIAGWSSKIFELMADFEGDPRKSIRKIKELYPERDLVHA